jgi:hypothetical protein
MIGEAVWPLEARHDHDAQSMTTKRWLLTLETQGSLGNQARMKQQPYATHANKSQVSS